MPFYFAMSLAFLVSAVVALTFAALGATVLDFFLGKFHRPDDLGDAILAAFFAAPSIAILGFVACSSVLINRHHAISWQVPTFAFALSASLVWAWAHDFGGISFAWYMPGIMTWLGSGLYWAAAAA
jgi:hypothetical protein